MNDDRVRDGRLLAAAQGINLDAGHVGNSTREYWYERADHAHAQLSKFAGHIETCEWPDCDARFRGDWAQIEVVNHVSTVHLRGAR
jgi:hypothetical protein